MGDSKNSTANFTGVLVRRKYWHGQKCIQLIFKTAEGLKLSITKNPGLARTLSVGQTYEVKGRLHRLGQKTFISEPTATLVMPSVSFFKRNLWAIMAVAVFICATGTASAITLTSHDAPAEPKQSSSAPADDEKDEKDESQTQTTAVETATDTAGYDETADVGEPFPYGTANYPVQQSTTPPVVQPQAPPAQQPAEQTPTEEVVTPAEETPVEELPVETPPAEL